MNTEQAAELGYETPQKAKGFYLSLESKGDQARVRIVSKPLKFTESFEAQEGKPAKTTSRWAWIVIHKEMTEGVASKTVRAFKGGPMIYGLIYDYVASEEWGDPTHYDLMITRTEEKGRYYTVTALPKSMGTISEADQKLVEEAALNLRALFLGEGVPESEGNPEADPFADE